MLVGWLVGWLVLTLFKKHCYFLMSTLPMYLYKQNKQFKQYKQYRQYNSRGLPTVLAGPPGLSSAIMCDIAV